MQFLTVVGHINVDIILEIGGIPPFGSEEVKGVRRSLGGTGANIAKFSAALGTPVELISKISKSFPEELLDDLENEKIKLTLEREDDEGPICYILDSKDKQTAFVYQGPMKTPGKIYEIDSRYCHFATSNPDWILALMKKCHGTKVFDPGQEAKYRWEREKLIEAIKQADLLILNEDEFKYVSTIKSPDPERTVITLGGRGAMYDNKIFETEYVEGVSTVGAGDMFRAAFYSSLYMGGSIRDSVGMANKITSIYLKYGLESLRGFKWEDQRSPNL
ncbi:MAG: PfkB family carbohydrate kinase [Thermoplasmatales archaeon]